MAGVLLNFLEGSDFNFLEVLVININSEEINLTVFTTPPKYRV